MDIDIEQVIVDQNIHWNNKPLFANGVVRETFTKIKQYLPLPHIISIVGVRRSGKSTILKQVINFLMTEADVPSKNLLFLNLEHPAFISFRHDANYLEKIYTKYLKIANPKGLVYVFLDEIQFFSDWQVFVKAHYEQKTIKFIITGSNSKLLSSEFITLLSGRTLPIEIFPFSFTEFLTTKKLSITNKIDQIRERHLIQHAFDEYLRFGGFPEIAFIENEMIKKDILNTYVKNSLYQDIVPRFNIKKIVDLENLYFYLNSNVSRLFTYHKLAKLINLSDKVIKDYISFFTDTYLLFPVNAFSFSIKKQINDPKKIYAIDNGFINAFSFGFSQDYGHLLENIVFLTLKKQGKEIFYYKTSSNLEVDFICREHKKITDLVQVTKEMRTLDSRNRELKALLHAMEETNVQNATIVTYEDEETIKQENKTINVVPAYKFLCDSSTLNT